MAPIQVQHLVFRVALALLAIRVFRRDVDAYVRVALALATAGKRVQSVKKLANATTLHCLSITLPTASA